MIFGALDSSLWCLEFILELSSAILFFKHFRSIKSLWIYLAFRAAADLISFAVACGWGPAGYGWANYWQRTIQYVLLAILAMRCIGVAVNADSRTVGRYRNLAVVLGLGAILIAHGGPWTAASLLFASARFDFALAALIAGALLLRELEIIVSPIEKPWGWICCGVLIAVGSHAAFSLLLAHRIMDETAASRLMACGQVLALGLWAWGARQAPESNEVARVSLGHEVPSTCWLDESGKMEC